MKDKIQEIASKSCCLLSEESLEKFQQLMCNEAVSACLTTYEEFGFSAADIYIINGLKNKYPEQTIKTAIENYKKEVG